MIYDLDHTFIDLLSVLYIQKESTLIKSCKISKFYFIGIKKLQLKKLTKNHFNWNI